MEEEKSFKTQKKVFKKGSIIFKEGEQSKNLYVLQYGSVKIFKNIYKDGKIIEMNLAKMNIGEIFGEMAMLDNSSRSASAKALEDTLCLVITRDVFKTHIADMPNWVSKVFYKMANRLRETNKLLKQEIEG